MMRRTGENHHPVADDGVHDDKNNLDGNQVRSASSCWEDMATLYENWERLDKIRTIEFWNVSTERKYGTQVWNASTERKYGTQVRNTSTERKYRTQK